MIKIFNNQHAQIIVIYYFLFNFENQLIAISNLNLALTYSPCLELSSFPIYKTELYAKLNKAISMKTLAIIS